MTFKEKILSLCVALFGTPRHSRLTLFIQSLSQKMRPTEKFIFWLLATIVIVTGLTLVLRVNSLFLVEVPGRGGEIHEGLVGNPRFINPILAISDTDKDLAYLTYSGLLKRDVSNKFIPDLAESYTVSDDGRVYTFLIRQTAVFHDNIPVTPDDIIFTVQKTLDPQIKSPKQASWEGIAVEKVGDREIRFTLPEPNSSFFETLTLGILPSHLWREVTNEEFPFVELNIRPIGSGPFKFDSLSKNSDGVPESITLSSFKKYSLGRPYIDKITFTFFGNEVGLVEAYEKGNIKSFVLSSSALLNEIKNESKKVTAALPRVFGVFFNQNSSRALLQKEVREALLLATPKNDIVENVLNGRGLVIDGPLPSQSTTSAPTTSSIELLAASGWVKNELGIMEKKTKNETITLEFSITTSDSPELKQAADMLAASWQAIGASVSIKVFEPADLQSIIKSRKYESLLFGEVVRDPSDLYPFWHSSARTDPGLNIALYTNLSADRALQNIKSAKVDQDLKELSKPLLDEIKNDLPSIFLFSPHLTYITPKNTKNLSLPEVAYKYERFSTANDWYTHTDKVWKIFAPKDR